MKATILLFLCTYISISLPAQVAGPNNPNSFSNALIPGFSQQWTNVSNVQLDDENYASFGDLAGAVGTHTDYLVATDYGFLLPAGTIINGIKVEVKCSDPNSRTADYSVRIIKAGTITALEKATGAAYPAADDYMTYGGPTDLWGETWDYKFIDDNKFGVAIAAQRNKNDDVATAGQVNNIRITVYYTFISLPVDLISFTATQQNKTVQLHWRTAAEININNYQVERSADGRNFNSITTIQGLNSPVADYSYADNFPLSGVSYYRLNIQGISGYQKYSQVVSVRYNAKNAVSLFPSPWQKGEDLNITNDNNEKLIIYFFNAGGQVMSAVTTQTKLVPTETLDIRKGMTPYKIYNSKMELIGTGRIVIL